VKRLIVISIALAVSSPALASHRKLSSKRSHRTTVAQAKAANNPHVQMAGDPTDPLGGLGTIPHKKSKKH